MEVRHMVSMTFATLIRLLPLEAGVPDPPGMSAEVMAQKKRERQFLENLLDPSTLTQYK